VTGNNVVDVGPDHKDIIRSCKDLDFIQIEMVTLESFEKRFVYLYVTVLQEN